MSNIFKDEDGSWVFQPEGGEPQYFESRKEARQAKESFLFSQEEEAEEIEEEEIEEVDVEEQSQEEEKEEVPKEMTREQLTQNLYKLMKSKVSSFRKESSESKKGFTANEVKVLKAIDDEGETVQKVISERLVCASSNLTPVLDRLQDRGLVERRKSFRKGDRRNVYVSLTDEGFEAKNSLEEVDFSVSVFTENLSDEEMSDLGELLNKLK